jgi:anaerobic magnesium-protoporphyrin IX monomethyl ester cyclase
VPGTMRRAACEMIASAHNAGARVIAAGPDVSDAPGPYLRAGADLALIGEGLSALLKLLPRLDARPDARTEDLIEGLAGVASLSQGKVITANGAKVLPMPTTTGSPPGISSTWSATARCGGRSTATSV